ncbi:hypothetical protein P175DRAFT_0499171 [Aspergillus ochraceoroseus IBT 24754]|uniref:Uncharacterized protein n=1 Tax=Aspergillus ochraceoroseus IBT 24754 TaxID=1392256 RepID=A0A2T5M288_9EURO|nr:uncharacterized protein P175DRAFT_0499171 [Aspergillus ochraceoroseus IBT 24754]PTU22641.1 hypothetical protein P175DRAFT_0499171 [Aspergillus ochraceoroseus IBT 24754]
MRPSFTVHLQLALPVVGIPWRIDTSSFCFSSSRNESLRMMREEKLRRRSKGSELLQDMDTLSIVRLEAGYDVPLEMRRVSHKE